MYRKLGDFHENTDLWAWGQKKDLLGIISKFKTNTSNGRNWMTCLFKNPHGNIGSIIFFIRELIDFYH